MTSFQEDVGDTGAAHKCAGWQATRRNSKIVACLKGAAKCPLHVALEVQQLLQPPP